MEYKTELPNSQDPRCPVQMQKETKEGLVDEACGYTADEGHGGYCK